MKVMSLCILLEKLVWLFISMAIKNPAIAGLLTMGKRVFLGFVSRSGPRAWLLFVAGESIDETKG